MIVLICGLTGMLTYENIRSLGGSIKMATQYAKPEFILSWSEGDHYLLDGHRVDFRAGQEVAVRWPDATETVERVVIRQEAVTVNDMGNRYEGIRSVPVVVVLYHGHPVDIRIANLEIALVSHGDGD